MAGGEVDPVIARVRQRLGRSGAARSLPVPPTIDEPVVRLVHAEIGLAELFVRGATTAGISAMLVHPDELASRLVADLQRIGLGQVSLEPVPLLAKLGVTDALTGGSVRVTSDAGCRVVALYAAVAETGTLVFRPMPAAATHLFVIVEPRHLVADLLDLFQKLSDDPEVSSTLLLTGTRPRVTAYVLH